AAALDTDVRFAHPGPIDDQRVGDDALERVSVADAGRLPHAVAQHLAAAELALVAVDGRILLDRDHESGVAEAHAIACRGTEDTGVGRPLHALPHARPAAVTSRPSVTGPVAQLLPPWMTRRPAIGTSRTVFVSPGSNRTAVPAGMSRRMPCAAFRSNMRAAFVSTKW